MSEQVKVPDSVHKEASRIAEERDTSIKEAIRLVFIEAGYNV